MRLRILTLFLGSLLLLSCTVTQVKQEKVTRKLINAKSYSHPNKKSTKEDLQLCQKKVLDEEVDNCLSEKGWVITVNRYD